MAREQDFVHATTVVTEDFLDALQEVVSALATNTRVVQSSATQVQVVPGHSDDGTLGLTVNGKLRYASGIKTHTLAGAAGTYNVFAVADVAGRDFTVVSTTSSAPAGATNFRRIAQVVWSGTAITGFTNELGVQPSSSPTLTGTPTTPTPTSTSDGTQVTNTEWVNDRILDAMPIGVVLDYTLPTLPSGGKWEWADGEPITAANTAAAPYRAALVTAGNPYGVSGTDPRKPDYRGRVGAGMHSMGIGATSDTTRQIGAVLGGTGGVKDVALGVTQIPPHTHANTLSDPGHGHSASGGDDGHGHGGGIGVNGGHNHYSASAGNFWVNKTPASLFVNHVSGGAHAFGQDALTETRAGHDHGLSINTGYASVWVSVSANYTGIGINNASAGGNGAGAAAAHDNMPPHIRVGKIVKVA